MLILSVSSCTEFNKSIVLKCLWGKFNSFLSLLPVLTLNPPFPKLFLAVSPGICFPISKHYAHTAVSISILNIFRCKVELYSAPPTAPVFSIFLYHYVLLFKPMFRVVTGTNSVVPPPPKKRISISCNPGNLWILPNMAKGFEMWVN